MYARAATGCWRSAPPRPAPWKPPFAHPTSLLTNFHFPRTTLLLLVQALAGTDLTRRAYEAAIERAYRFYSYGDCMVIL